MNLPWGGEVYFYHTSNTHTKGFGENETEEPQAHHTAEQCLLLLNVDGVVKIPEDAMSY